MNYPTYVVVNGTKYDINTDFRIALKCNQIAEDNTIGDYERALAIIYTLFGEKGLNAQDDHQMLLELAIKYLRCGEEPNTKPNEKKDLDFFQDEKYIKSSFKFDYNYNPYEMKYLHWWEFWNDLNNLSNSEFGSCCILNRVRQLRNYDVSKIKDPKEKADMIEAKKRVELKQPKKRMTFTEKESSRRFFEELFKNDEMR